jgi:hypothetical protein
MAAEPEFYVGYLGMPKALGRFLRVRVILLLLAFPLVALAIAWTQRPIGPGTFEFGVVQTFEGVLQDQPYPMLQVTRPGRNGQAPAQSLYLLGVFGKYGADALVAGLGGHRVRLQGSLIYRDDQVMIEIDGQRPTDLGIGHLQAGQDLGKIQIVGEIVDSKCFLGVMKPGNLKTHKACAIRCISGGVPPVLLVRDELGRAHYMLLTDPEGRAINDRVLDYVAEPVRVSGQLQRTSNLYQLRMDPAAIEPLE